MLRPARSARHVLVAMAVLLVVAGCSSSGSDNLVAVARDQPTPAPQSSATAVPTTDVVLEPATPLPTPITLSGGQGIVVTPTPEGGVPTEPAEPELADDGELTYNEAVGIEDTGPSSPTPTYNEAVGINPTATPVPPTPTPPAAGQPTPRPQPTAQPQPTPDTSNQVINVTNGGEVYTLKCARCHGADGAGDLGYTGIVGATAKYGGQAGLIEELTNGHPFTFGFADKLSPQEIVDVVAYVDATFG